MLTPGLSKRPALARLVHRLNEGNGAALRIQHRELPGATVGAPQRTVRMHGTGRFALA